jgi:putative ABC transport system permease protein
MVRLALRTLRFRAGRFVACFVVLFFGALIVMSCGGLMETGIRAAVTPQRLAAAPIVVTGDPNYPEQARIDASLVAAIKGVPGVAEAVPDLSFPAVPLRHHEPVAGGTGLLGHGWASTGLAPYRLVRGVAPKRPDEVVFDQVLLRETEAEVGDLLDIAVAGEARRFRIAGVVGSTSVPSDQRPAMFFSDSYAQKLAGARGEIDNIGVLADPSADLGELQRAVAAALEGHSVAVLTGDDRGLAEFSGVRAGGETLVVIAAVFGGLAVMVAVFVVASILGLSVQQRYREMALLRAIGATPGQVRRLVLGEALVVAVLATALAYVPNVYVGRWLLSQLAVREVVPSAIVYRQGWIPTVSALGVALLSALGAAYIAGRSAARARPTDALLEASLPRRWLSWTRLVFAVLCLGGGLALTIVTGTVMSGPVAASTAGPMAMLWAAGLALLSPGITRALIAVLRWPFQALSGQAGHIAIQNLNARRIRVAAAITPIMLATGLATAFIYMQAAQARASERAYTESLRADAVLISTVGGCPLDFVRTVRSLSDVGAASALVPSRGYFVPGDDSDEIPVFGVSAEGVADTMAVPLTEGMLSDLNGSTVALTTKHAAQRKLRLGDTMQMRMGDGALVGLRVVAVFISRPGYEAALLPAPLVLEHTTSGLVPQILVHARPGTDPARLIDTLAALSSSEPGLRIANRDQVLAGQAEQEQTGAWVNYLLVAMIIGYTVISLVNALVIATCERRREFALQQLIGSTRDQIMRMMSLEASLIAFGGVLLGTVVAGATLVAFDMALNGTPLPDGPAWIYFTIVAAAIVLTMIVVLLTTFFVLRTRPIDVAARDE